MCRYDSNSANTTDSGSRNFMHNIVSMYYVLIAYTFNNKSLRRRIDILKSGWQVRNKTYFLLTRNTYGMRQFIEILDVMFGDVEVGPVDSTKLPNKLLQARGLHFEIL